LRRADLTRVAATLVVAVLLIDVFWGLVAESTGSLAYGLVDLPAHLATCAIALLALLALRAAAPARAFVLAALAASVLLDLDHIPGYLGTHALTGTLPRPYAHTFLFLALVLGAAFLARRRPVGPVLLGVAFGIGAHLFRDLATGPGVAALWPLSSGSIQMPYVLYAGALLLALIACLPRRSARLAHGTAALLLIAIAGLALLAPGTASARRIALGVYVRGLEDSPGQLDRYSEEVGRPPTIVGAYKRWDVQPFYTPELHEIASRGAVPMVSWEPWDEQDHGFPLKAIAHGRYDFYVRRSAREAMEWGGPILLRFGQEMNGAWAPWQRGRDGTTGPRFVAAWRHLVRVFRQVGADNVSWVWCPYVDNTGRNPYMDFYPGNRWVDWLALDGFNWGEPTAWQSFPKIFDRSYRKLVSISPRKPIMISEIGSSEAGGSKPRWLRRTLERALPRLKRVRAVVWFDAPDGPDFRVDSSEAALAAFRAGIRSPLYSGGRDLLDHVSHLSGP
jgi:membrane-bound metal-dependent hydrolase YbcI (DUF457 family)